MLLVYSLRRTLFYRLLLLPRNTLVLNPKSGKIVIGLYMPHLHHRFVTKYIRISLYFSLQIHSSLFQRREISDTYQLPHVEFDVECITQSAFTTLCHEITVTGVEGNGEKVFFTIKSDKNHG